MILRGKFFVAALLCYTFSLISAVKQQPIPPQEETSTPRKQRRHFVKVLLEEAAYEKPFKWVITCSQGFALIDPETKTKTLVDMDTITIRSKNEIFFFNGQKYDKNKFCICPREGNLQLNGNEYQGNFILTKNKNSFFLINSIDIEEYVCSVLKTESWPGWPLEINKAFAIASRSYVFGVILAQKGSKLPYHVKNTTKHQTYTGTHTDPILKEAVEQTRGVFLTYEKKPIIAMFDVCCGGVIPADIEGVDFVHSPYLARTYRCNYCSNAKVFSWKVTYTRSKLEELLKKEHPEIKKIEEITVNKRDKAGLAKQIAVKTPQKTYYFTGKKMYSLLPNVKSYCFDINFKKNDAIITGYGYGHHLGVCQWGARHMVRLGYDYKTVLQFYYPEATFMKLT